MKKKIIISSIVFILLMILFQISLYAESTGTIKFEAINNNNGTVISDLEVSVYKVRDFDNNKSNLTEDFKNCDVEFENNISESNMFKLEKYALSNSSPILTKSTDKNGQIYLDNLELGTYLLVQNNKIETYIMQTMLIQVPEVSSVNGFNYSVTVKPKISEVAIGGAEVEEENFHNQEAKQIKEVVKDEVLPNTGVLNWPIPVLAVSGLIVFCISWISFYSKKKVK